MSVNHLKSVILNTSWFLCRQVIGQYKLGQKCRLEAIQFHSSKDGSMVVCSQASFFVQQEESTTALLAFNTKTHEHRQLDPAEGEQLNLDGAAITEDGKYFLQQLQNVRKSALWDTTSGRLVHLLDDANWGRSVVEISSKSMRAVTSNSDGNGLLVWDIQSGKLVHEFVTGEIAKIFFIRDGTIAITTDSKGYQPISFEAWDLVKGKKLTTYTVDTSPFAICPLGDNIAFAAPASVTVMSLELHVPGIEKAKFRPSSYGVYKGLNEFKGMQDPCDANDVDDDKDDDETNVSQ